MMNTVLRTLSVVLAFLLSAPISAQSAQSDANQWLEDTSSAETKLWVVEHNAKTLARLQADPRFAEVKKRAMSILDRPDRLPGPTETRQYNGQIYNILQDSDHPRGLLRTASLHSYAQGNPAWRDLVDFEALGQAEGRAWFGSLAQASFSPSGRRMLVAMSDGGNDAVTLRELDLETGHFVSGGFATPEGRQTAVWIDDDTLAIALVLNPDDATLAGFPRKLRLWKRGHDLLNTEAILTVPTSKVLLQPIALESATWRETGVLSVSGDFTADVFLIGEEQSVSKLELPGPLGISAFNGLTGIGSQMLIDVGENWLVDGKPVAAGTIVAIDVPKITNGAEQGSRAISVVYEPSADEALSSFNNITVIRDQVYVNILKNAASQLRKIEQDAGKEWRMSEVTGIPGPGTVWLPLYNDPHAETLVFRYEDFLTPLTEFRLENGTPVVIRREVSSMAVSRFVTEQFFAIADDGTRIPYFVTRARDLAFDGEAPVLMYGYGGFGYTVTPSFEVAYSGPLHELWLDSGGVFVSVNPRGGGEYGPSWHDAARGLTRQMVYDDIYAITEDLISRKIGGAGRIGFIGGSNGGLTAAVLAVQRPDLFAASIAVVPIIDMIRYPKLLAGSAWISEYGNPEVEAEQQVLLSYSPYHTIVPGGTYPEMLLMTSTRDDRVHPGHARKFAARLEEQGHPVLFYEAEQGGHAMAVDNEGRAINAAIMAVYLFQRLRVR